MLGENTLLIVFDFFVTVAMIHAIRYIWNRDRDLLDRPGQVGLGKRGKGERGSKTREKKESVRVTLEPRYCGRADSSLVD